MLMSVNVCALLGTLITLASHQALAYQPLNRVACHHTFQLQSKVGHFSDYFTTYYHRQHEDHSQF